MTRKGSTSVSQARGSSRSFFTHVCAPFSRAFLPLHRKKHTNVGSEGSLPSETTPPTDTSAPAPILISHTILRQTGSFLPWVHLVLCITRLSAGESLGVCFLPFSPLVSSSVPSPAGAPLQLSTKDSVSLQARATRSAVASVTSGMRVPHPQPSPAQ